MHVQMYMYVTCVYELVEEMNRQGILIPTHSLARMHIPGRVDTITHSHPHMHRASNITYLGYREGKAGRRDVRSRSISLALLKIAIKVWIEYVVIIVIQLICLPTTHPLPSLLFGHGDRITVTRAESCVRLCRSLVSSCNERTPPISAIVCASISRLIGCSPISQI